MKIHSKTIIVITILFTALTQAQEKRLIPLHDGPPPRPSFSLLDTNSDGEITFDEFSAHKLPKGNHETVFPKIDKDSNRVISQEEFISHKPPKKKGKK